MVSLSGSENIENYIPQTNRRFARACDARSWAAESYHANTEAFRRRIGSISRFGREMTRERAKESKGDRERERKRWREETMKGRLPASNQAVPLSHISPIDQLSRVASTTGRAFPQKLMPSHPPVHTHRLLQSQSRSLPDNGLIPFPTGINARIREFPATDPEASIR
jgi:hypothetical protein